MKTILFIDRDGTLIVEPPDTFQIDSVDKLRFLPGTITWLARIARELDHELVMVTNQDGLGTDSFPEADFWPAHNAMLRVLESEGVRFSEVLIDRSFEHENSPTRKPRTGLLERYLDGSYDLANSWVIGDRSTDVQLARNLGARAMVLPGLQAVEKIAPELDVRVDDWRGVYTVLRAGTRRVEHRRTTRETDVRVTLDLDGSGESHIATGLGFLDHMLDQIARHGHIQLVVETKGDLHIDEHHTVEDTAITLGEAFAKALGNKLGIERYGYSLPMDDSEARVLIDFGGRSYLRWETEFRRERIGDVPTELFPHFFRSFADGAKADLHISARGDNEHHKIEAVFKAFAKAVRMAVKRDPEHLVLPSTKGLLCCGSQSSATPQAMCAAWNSR
jgi:imidazoleglycerol-phosphate dehydratase/histidinol-phosphatase